MRTRRSVTPKTPRRGARAPRLNFAPRRRALSADWPSPRARPASHPGSATSQPSVASRAREGAAALRGAEPPPCWAGWGAGGGGLRHGGSGHPGTAPASAPRCVTNPGIPSDPVYNSIILHQLPCNLRTPSHPIPYETPSHPLCNPTIPYHPQCHPRAPSYPLYNLRTPFHLLYNPQNPILSPI